MISIQAFGSSSKGNCYRIKTSTNGDELLLDAGLAFKDIQRYCRFNFVHLCGVLVTHQHGDHCKAVSDLLKLGHCVYMLKDTAEAIYVAGHHKVVYITPKIQFSIGSFTILPFELEHDVPNVGFLITDGEEKLLYITDTYYCRYTFKDVNHIMVECNHSYEILNQRVDDGCLHEKRMERLIQSHFSLENVIKFLKSMDLTKCQDIRLLHLSDENSDAAMFKQAVEAATGKYVVVEQERSPL